MRTSAKPAPGASLLAAACGLIFGCATTQQPAGLVQPRRSPDMRKVKHVDVPLIEHRLTPEEIADREARARTACHEKLSSIAAMPAAQRTFANTVDALEQAVMDYLDTTQRLGILKELHTDEKVRRAAGEVEEAAGKYLVALSARRDLYRAVQAWVDGPGRTEELDPQQQRLLELTLRELKRSGHRLNDEQLAELVRLRTRMAELGMQFQRNLNENTDSVEFEEAELAGLPEAFVKRLKKAPNGRTIVTTKTPDYVAFMENARNEAARRRLYVAYMSREAGTNIPILKEVLALRHQAARLLGYEHHADYVTEDRMAKNARNVAEFLASLRTQLKPRRDQDFGKLTALKRTETNRPDAVLEPWDVTYFFSQLKKRDYALDNEKIREFFPMQTVLSGMYRVYETLFGIEIAEPSLYPELIAEYALAPSEEGAGRGGDAAIDKLLAMRQAARKAKDFA
ncbi:MAG: M3 family metallopeptidase, partial [Myxococcales bacterium]